MAKDNGGIIGVLNTPSTSLASGVWALEDQYQAKLGGTWPFPFNLGSSSARFNSGSSDYLTKTFGSNGTRTTWTYSLWIKRANLGANTRIMTASDNSTFDDFFRFTSSDTIQWDFNNSSASLITTQVFRDVSAWYHIVVACDTTQATSSNRMKLYVNGSQITDLSTATYPSQNSTGSINSTVPQNIGVTNSINLSQFYNGYLSEIHFIDGQQLTPSSFGQTDSTTGIWIPKAYTGTYGTNGFYLNFSNAASLGTDASGNGNNFTVNNLTSVDQSKDNPTNNWCTLNPLLTPTSGSAGGLSDGNLTHTAAYQNGGTFFLDKDSTGKWYWECKVISGANSSLDIAFGFSSDKNIRNDGSSSWAVTNTLWLYSTDGSKFTGSWTSSAGATFTNGDIIGMALDLNGDTITFYKNGVSQFTISSLTIDGTAITPWIQNTVTGCVVSANFGQPPYSVSGGYSDANGYGNFTYQPPSGFLALCTNNLASNG